MLLYISKWKEFNGTFVKYNFNTVLCVILYSFKDACQYAGFNQMQTLFRYVGRWCCDQIERQKCDSSIHTINMWSSHLVV